MMTENVEPLESVASGAVAVIESPTPASTVHAAVTDWFGIGSPEASVILIVTVCVVVGGVAVFGALNWHGLTASAPTSTTNGIVTVA